MVPRLTVGVRTMTSFVLIKDKFGQVHADSVCGEVDHKAIQFAVDRLAEDLGLDDDGFDVALCHARDAGAARLKWGQDGTHEYGRMKVTADEAAFLRRAEEFEREELRTHLDTE